MITEKDIGKRVIVNGTANGVKFENEEGVINSLKGYFVGVTFNHFNARFHHCYEKCVEGYGWFVTEDIITFKKENKKMTGIRIETEKVVDDTGILCREILKIKALSKDKLPDIYLLSEGPIVWKFGVNLHLENVKNQIHSHCNIMQGERYSEEFFEKCLDHCRAAGDNLMECNRRLAEKKANWHGEETFII
jgi:hypothetical protein